jgi:drug/metabolite transporter (DMT)-like permease
MQCVRNCDSEDPRERQNFEQPVLQTLQMFIGEMLSWLVIGAYSLFTHIRNKRSSVSLLQPSEHDALLEEDGTLVGDSEDTFTSYDALASSDPLASSLTLPHDPHDGREHMKGWKVAYLALPACCDIAGTTLMNVGLLFVAASIYQMTRGALVLFVGLFSVLFLKRHLSLYKWLALVVVVSGVALVGLAGVIEKDHKSVPSVLIAMLTGQEETPAAIKTLIGVSLIAAAQIFTATQFVVEESIMERYSLEPLKAVGWEGFWGFVVTLIGMVILHFAYGVTEAGQYGYFDAREGFHQMFHNRAIAVSSVLIMISIGYVSTLEDSDEALTFPSGFNFFGLSVTRTVSATSRSTIDTCRTLFIWIISLGLGWESFKWIQVAGFALLVYGTFLFNDLINPPFEACMPKDDEDLEEEEDII